MPPHPQTPIIVQTSLPTAALADTIGRACVQGRIAACAHTSPIQSIYRWEEAVEDATEVLLRITTIQASYAAVCATITAHHPYDCPAILALPILEGDPGYLSWLATNATPRTTPIA